MNVDEDKHEHNGADVLGTTVHKAMQAIRSLSHCIWMCT